MAKTSTQVSAAGAVDIMHAADGYQEAVRRLNAITAKHAELQAECNALQQTMATANQQSVDDILADVPPAPKASEEYAQLVEAVGRLTRAIDEQKNVVSIEQAKAVEKARQHLAPQRAQLIEAQANAVRQFIDAIEAHQKFHADFETATGAEAFAGSWPCSAIAIYSAGSAEIVEILKKYLAEHRATAFSVKQ